MTGVNATDRIVSAISYFTCGIFSIIWIVYANITRKRMTSYLQFNLYQAIFVSVVLAAISLLYSIAINILAAIPFIGSIAKAFNLFFMYKPVLLNYTISGLIVTIFLCYLVVFSLIGRRPYVPLISDVVNLNFGG